LGRRRKIFGWIRTSPRNSWWRALCLYGLLLLAFFVGCTPPTALPVPTPTITVTPTATVTPTVTPVWFPPTETPTSVPTATILPTPSADLYRGPLVFDENLAETEAFPLLNSARGRIAQGNDALTIAITESDTYLSSVMFQPIVGNFYVEITASVSLCRSEDEYGLILRQASPADFYRFSLSCNGQLRLDRLYRGAASSPQPLTFSAAVPPAAPGSVRIGVWAWGDEMRFYIDGQYQFTIDDPTLPSGVLGVFARSRDNAALTVNFTDLRIWLLQ